MNTNFEEMLQEQPLVINVGLRGFAEILEEQEVEVIHVEWSPPAGGDEDLAELLKELL